MNIQALTRALDDAEQAEEIQREGACLPILEMLLSLLTTLFKEKCND